MLYESLWTVVIVMDTDEIHHKEKFPVHEHISLQGYNI